MKGPKFPRTALKWTRVEHTELPLDVLEGELPADLKGSYFFMSAAAHPGMGETGSSADWPTRGSVINGDGMVYRVDLDASPNPLVSSRIIKTADFHADEATATEPRLEKLRFRDLGMMRVSPELGARNFANTALLPVGPFAEQTRLYACYDAGTPVEIDPVTLDTLDPLGSRSDWKPEALSFLPFPPILSTAHPFYDTHDDSLWTVNFGIGLRSKIAGREASSSGWAARVLGPAAEWLATRLQADAERDLEWLARILRKLLLGHSTPRPHRAGRGEDPRRRPEPEGDASLIPSDFVRLLRFRGEEPPAILELVDDEGEPVTILESLHQIAATRNWVIIMDTCFDLRIEQFYGDPLPDHPAFERLLRHLTAHQQLGFCPLWLVEREAYEKAAAGGQRQVRATRVHLPLGSVHFLADYADDDDRLTLHVAHGVALDIAEWVRAFDRLRFVDDDSAVEELQGMITSAVDNSRIGRWEVDARTGGIVSSSLVSSEDTWGIALYAGDQMPCWGAPQERIESMFWFTSGLWPELMTEFIWDLYSDIPDREVQLDTIADLMERGGTPSALLRIDTNPLAIADVFRFPEGTTPSSPQFVPGGDGGYVFQTVWSATSSEIWLFRAQDLAAGPIARLGADALQFGFSLHACWLPEPRATGRKASSIKQQLEGWKATDPRLAEAFEKFVYPRHR